MFDAMTWPTLENEIGHPISAVMVMVVTGVGSFIHLYSAGYMAHDEDFARYFTYLNLFAFSMLILVLADNLLMMFVGWEGVGLCSYLLIGFYFHRHSASTAARPATAAQEHRLWYQFYFHTPRGVAGRRAASRSI